MARLLGPRSSTTRAGRMGKHKHRFFLSLQQSLLATTGSLEENMLPLLRYWLSLIVKKALMLCYCKFLALISHSGFFFMWDEICTGKKLLPTWAQRPSRGSIFQSFICLWVKIEPRNKSACSKLIPVQSSRSKLTTCPKEKGVCSDLNWTAQWQWKTSDYGAQKLEIDVTVWHHSELITAKVCSVILNKLQPKFAVANEMWLCKPCSDHNWQEELQRSIWRFFEQSAFLNSHLLCYGPTI